MIAANNHYKDMCQFDKDNLLQKYQVIGSF